MQHHLKASAPGIVGCESLRGNMLFAIMKCPHCRDTFFSNFKATALGVDAGGGWYLNQQKCPSCNRFILVLECGHAIVNGLGQLVQITDPRSLQVYPKGSLRPQCPKEVPKDLASDYGESCLVLPDSAKASAALSRRCLQHLLRETAKVKHADLSREIQELLDRGTLPSHIAEALDAVRNIGNFAAHPIKSQHSGEVLEVEPGEAEWNLDVLESLFDFYFLQPAILQAKKAALNAKLKEAGKPPIK
jgi:hypothetical protein